jgi:hypothetical protein
LRLSRDEQGTDLFLTPIEQAERQRAADAERIRQLEAELAKRQG